MSEHTPKYREKCLEEKGERCHICDAETEIEVHHIDGDRYNNTLDNLIPVCENCHDLIHSSDSELEEWSDKLLPEEQRPHIEDRKKVGSFDSAPKYVDRSVSLLGSSFGLSLSEAQMDALGWEYNDTLIVKLDEENDRLLVKEFEDALKPGVFD